jgi:hypothetical protein
MHAHTHLLCAIRAAGISLGGFFSIQPSPKHCAMVSTRHLYQPYTRPAGPLSVVGPAAGINAGAFFRRSDSLPVYLFFPKKDFFKKHLKKSRKVEKKKEKKKKKKNCELIRKGSLRANFKIIIIVKK